MPLSALGAWFAAGALTQRRRLRLAAALLWAGAPALQVAPQPGPPRPAGCARDDAAACPGPPARHRLGPGPRTFCGAGPGGAALHGETSGQARHQRKPRPGPRQPRPDWRWPSSPRRRRHCCCPPLSLSRFAACCWDAADAPSGGRCCPAWPCSFPLPSPCWTGPAPCSPILACRWVSTRLRSGSRYWASRCASTPAQAVAGLAPFGPGAVPWALLLACCSACRAAAGPDGTLSPGPARGRPAGPAGPLPLGCRTLILAGGWLAGHVATGASAEVLVTPFTGPAVSAAAFTLLERP